MRKVVVTGADTPLAERVVALAAAFHAAKESAGDVVVAGAACAVPGTPAGVEVQRLDIVTDDLKPVLEGADALVHLAVSTPASPSAATDDVEVARRVLDAAGATGIRHVDQARSEALFERALDIATQTLAPGGNFAPPSDDFARCVFQNPGTPCPFTITIPRPRIRGGLRPRPRRSRPLADKGGRRPPSRIESTDSPSELSGPRPHTRRRA